MRDRGRIWLGRGLLALGAGLLAFRLWSAVDGFAFQAALAGRLDALPRPGRARALVNEALATRREAVADGLIGRIEIPRLGMSALVVEGTSGRALRRGVGHVERTAFPGERGNAGLAAHRDGHFRPLKDVSLGDLIRIQTPDGVFDYRVESIQVVDPDRGDLLAATERPGLTLVTCYPFHWVGPAPRRFVVRARPIGSGPLSRDGGAADPSVMESPRTRLALVEWGRA